MRAASLTLPMSCIRLQLNRSMTSPRVWSSQVDQGLCCICGSVSGVTCSSPVSLAASSFATAWPRSGRAVWLLLGRGQVALFGFRLVEVRSWSAGSAWPRTGRELWDLLGRGPCSTSVASPASRVPCTVSSGFRGPSGSRPGCRARLRSEWCLCSLLFSGAGSFFQLSTAEVAFLSLGAWHNLSLAPMSNANSIDMSPWRWRRSSSLVMLFLAPTAVFRSWLVAPSAFSVSNGCRLWLRGAPGSLHIGGFLWSSSQVSLLSSLRYP